MLDYSLSREQLDELRAAHRRTRDKREADRIKAVVALATGWTAEEVAELLQIRLVPVDNSLIFINFMNRLRAKRTDSLTNRFFLLSIRPV